jgi:NAD-dependent dihydropyrimidine dehydrogenase PreA subunit
MGIGSHGPEEQTPFRIWKRANESVKAWIDQDLCTGDGLCEEIAPDEIWRVTTEHRECALAGHP